MKNDNFVKVYEGNACRVDLILALLKSNGIESAVKLDKSASAYVFLSLDDEIYVHKDDEAKALEVIKNDPGAKIN